MGKQVNPQVKLNVLRRANFKCYFCGTGGSQRNFLTIDHVKPKCHGGTNEQSNLVSCCKICNQKKGNMSLKSFVKKYKIKIPKSSGKVENEAKDVPFDYLEIGALMTIANVILFMMIHL